MNQQYVRISLIITMLCGWYIGGVLAGVTGPDHVVNWYISDEQGMTAGTGTSEEQETAARLLVDSLDDERRAQLSGGLMVYEMSFGVGEKENLGAIPYEFLGGGELLATLERVQLTEPGIGSPNGTSTQPFLDPDEVMQDASPFPSSLVGERFWHEKLGGSSSQRNAARFTIASGIDLQAFGVRVGDLETRTDGLGRPAEVLLFDTNEVLLDRIEITPQGIDQSTCGGDTSEDVLGCGNQTTRRLGFIIPEDVHVDVSTIVISVGDDDSGGSGENALGTTEHFSLIGPTFAYVCTDTDEDGVCDTEDICPNDPERTYVLGCGCGIIDPSNFGEVCVSGVNSCGMNATGSILCNGACSVSAPEESLCVVENGSGNGGGGGDDSGTEMGTGTSSSGENTVGSGAVGTGTTTESSNGSGFVLPDGLPDTGGYMLIK